MTPITISKNDSQISVVENSIREGLELLTRINEEYTKFGLRPLEKSDLSKLQNGEEFLKDILTEKVINPEVQGVKLSMAKFRDMICLPDEIDQFKALCAELKEGINSRYRNGFSFDYYTVKAGKIVEDESKIEKMRVSLYYIATNEKEHSFLKMATKIRDLANETVKFNQLNNLCPNRSFESFDFLKFDSTKNDYSIDGRILLSKAR